MSTLKVNNIDAFSNDGGQAVRVRSSLIIGGNTGSFGNNSAYTGSQEDIYGSLAIGYNVHALGENSIAMGQHSRS